MEEDLRNAYLLNAKEFSRLGSYYLYAYALLQIPLGVIIDWVGVTKTIVTSIILCIVGTIMLAVADTYGVAVLSRMIVGAGSASAFMGALKLVTERLPAGKRGFLMGATLMMGTIAPLLVSRPLVYMLEAYGWRNAVFATLIIGIGVFIMAFIALPKRDKSKPMVAHASLGKIGVGVLSVMKNRRIMIYAILAIGLYTPLSVMADLWGPAFLAEKFRLDKADAAQTTMMMYLGLAVGSFVLTGFCEKYNFLNGGIKVSSFAILICFSIVLYGKVVGIGVLTVVLFVLGFFCGAEMMCFTGAVLHTSHDNSGVTLGVVNTMNMLGGAVLQELIGWGLDLQWSGYMTQRGVRIYKVGEYTMLLSVLVALIAACCVLSLFLRENEES